MGKTSKTVDLDNDVPTGSKKSFNSKERVDEPQPGLPRLSRRLAEKKEQRQRVGGVGNSQVSKKRPTASNSTVKNEVDKGHKKRVTTLLNTGNAGEEGQNAFNNADIPPTDRMNCDNVDTLPRHSSNGVTTGLLCPVPDCLRTFKTNYWLMNHKEIHEGLKPFVCEICEFGYVDEFKLMEHVGQKHTKESLFDCDECTKSYKSKRFLDVHVAKCH